MSCSEVLISFVPTPTNLCVSRSFFVGVLVVLLTVAMFYCCIPAMRSGLMVTTCTTLVAEKA